MDAVVSESVSGLGQFDVLDATDLMEQSDDVRVAANATQSESDARRKKRGIERRSTSNLDYRHDSSKPLLE